MASTSVLSAVQHYQRSIEKSGDDVPRLLHCVGKLYKMPITVEHLQQTGVGRTVNALRKYNGELGVAAEAVVNKWKELVAAENDMRADNPSSDNEHDSGDDQDDDDNIAENEEPNLKRENTDHSNKNVINDKNSRSKDKQEKDTHKKHTSSKDHILSTKHSSTSSSSKRNHERDDEKEKHKEHRSSRKEKTEQENPEKHKSRRHEKSDNEKEKERDRRGDRSEKQSKEESKTSSKHSKDDSHKRHKEEHRSSLKEGEKHHHSSDKTKHRDDKEKEKSKSKSRSESYSQRKSPSGSTVASTSKPSTIAKLSTDTAGSSSASTERKRRHEDDPDIENSPKKVKTNLKPEKKSSKVVIETKEDENDDGIDSSMGANFADVLGMLNMPQKKAKKSLSALKNTSPKSTKKSSDSDYSKQSSTGIVNGIRKPDAPSTSQRILEKKPELLSSNVKLAPLDPTIALELPMISNNYKPLPLNPTVMDCVFNSSTSSSSRAPPRMLSDSEALSHGISSKTIRTKVYSGVKTGQLLQVPSLFDLCIRILQKNIDALEYTGGVPFDVLRPVLERATPQQLFTFEEYNPYLMEDSDVLWQQHVQRSYRCQKREEMETWREMYMRCQEDQERRLSRLAENIKQSQKAIALPVRKTQLAFVDSMVKPPRSVIRKQEQFGTKSKLVATPAARVAALSSVTPNAAKQGDTRLRVASSLAHDPAQVSHASARPKKAPLMAKTLQFMRGRHKR